MMGPCSIAFIIVSTTGGAVAREAEHTHTSDGCDGGDGCVADSLGQRGRPLQA